MSAPQRTTEAKTIASRTRTSERFIASSRLRRGPGAFLPLDDGAARDVHLHLVGDAQLHDVAIDGHDGTEESARGRHPIPGAQRFEHLLGLLLPDARRPD